MGINGSRIDMKMRNMYKKFIEITCLELQRGQVRKIDKKKKKGIKKKDVVLNEMTRITKIRMQQRKLKDGTFR